MSDYAGYYSIEEELKRAKKELAAAELELQHCDKSRKENVQNKIDNLKYTIADYEKQLRDM